MESRIIRRNDWQSRMTPYTLDGEEYAASSNWCPITFNEDTREGSYYFEMLPGAVTKPHIHRGFEEFLILQGEAIESDGRVLQAGDFAAYGPGSQHYTRTESGCVMLVVEWRPKEAPESKVEAD